MTFKPKFIVNNYSKFFLFVTVFHFNIVTDKCFIHCILSETHKMTFFQVQNGIIFVEPFVLLFQSLVLSFVLLVTGHCLNYITNYDQHKYLDQSFQQKERDYLRRCQKVEDLILNFVELQQLNHIPPT